MEREISSVGFFCTDETVRNHDTSEASFTVTAVHDIILFLILESGKVCPRHHPAPGVAAEDI
jgi:hypothetical protein